MSKRWDVASIASEVTAYFTSKKIADPSYSPNVDSVSQMVDRIAKVIMVESTAEIDKLVGIIDGENINLANEIVEYFLNIPMIQAYDDFEGNTNYDKTLAPYRIPGDKAYISERLGRKVFPITIDYEKYDVACVDEGEKANLIATFVYKLNQAKSLWKYNLKKNLLGTMAKKANAVGGTVNYTASSTVPVCGVVYKETGNTKLYIMKKNYASATSSTLAQLATAGDAVEITLDLVDSTTDRPVGTENCEKAILAFKNAITEAGYYKEGHCLSGTGCVASPDELVLFILKPYKNHIDTECLSGTFRPEYMGLNVKVVEVEDFGPDAPTNTWALLASTKGIKLHNNINKSLEQVNALGSYYTVFSHQEYEGFLSTHTFVKAFIKA